MRFPEFPSNLLQSTYSVCLPACQSANLPDIPLNMFCLQARLLTSPLGLLLLLLSPRRQFSLRVQANRMCVCACACAFLCTFSTISHSLPHSPRPPLNLNSTSSVLTVQVCVCEESMQVSVGVRTCGCSSENTHFPPNSLFE